jgi:hypothetical protein
MDDRGILAETITLNISPYVCSECLTVFETDNLPMPVDLTAAGQHQGGEATAALEDKGWPGLQTKIHDELEKISSRGPIRCKWYLLEV